MIKNGIVVDVRQRKVDFDFPDGLPSDLHAVLREAVACYEIGSSAATVVLAGLFLEGLLLTAGIEGDRLVEQIEEAHKKGAITPLGFHVASASRLLRNIGAHYSEELIGLTASDARLVLEMVRKLAVDLVAFICAPKGVISDMLTPAQRMEAAVAARRKRHGF